MNVRRWCVVVVALASLSACDPNQSGERPNQGDRGVARDPGVPADKRDGGYGKVKPSEQVLPTSDGGFINMTGQAQITGSSMRITIKDGLGNVVDLRSVELTSGDIYTHSHVYKQGDLPLYVTVVVTAPKGGGNGYCSITSKKHPMPGPGAYRELNKQKQAKCEMVERA